jgi:hypothetical protein
MSAIANQLCRELTLRNWLFFAIFRELHARSSNGRGMSPLVALPRHPVKNLAKFLAGDKLIGKLKVLLRPGMVRRVIKPRLKPLGLHQNHIGLHGRETLESLMVRVLVRPGT